MIASAGYDPSTPVAVGVRSASTTVLAAQGGTETGARYSCDSVAYAGSLAKQVTGACAAALALDGSLDVEEPIAGFLPEPPGWATDIRVRHLVHHTAGLPATESVWERMQGMGETDWTSDGILAALATFPAPEHPPGVVYEYSNVGYVCLARIVERVADDGLDTVARERFFAPLAMEATELRFDPSTVPLGSPAPLSAGDGGLWTTVSDLLRWNAALLEDRLGVTALMHTPGALDDGSPLDYAWGVRVTRAGAQRLQSHGGSWEDTTAKLVRLPDLGAGLAVLARDGSVERMTALASTVQRALIS